MEIINFSYNWNNKLNNKCFSTIRIYNPKKYSHGLIYGIYYKNILDFYAKVVYIKNFQFINLNKPMSYLDTGYGVEDTQNIIKKMYKNVKDYTWFHFIVLEKINGYNNV